MLFALSFLLGLLFVLLALPLSVLAISLIYDELESVPMISLNFFNRCSVREKRSIL